MSRNWSHMPQEILVSIFSLLSLLDRLNTAAAVCHSWRIAASDPSLTRSLDTTKCRASLRPATSRERAKLEVAQALAQGVSFGRANLTTLIVDPILKFSNRHFQHISLRCPNLEILTMPFPNAVTKACLSRTFRLWENLKTLHVPSGGSEQKLPPGILKIIGSSCRSLRVLKLSSETFTDKQLEAITNFFPGLRVLCVHCTVLESKLVKPFSDNASLEEVYLSISRFRAYPWLDYGRLQIIINEERRKKGFPDYHTFHLCRWILAPCGCLASELPV